MTKNLKFLLIAFLLLTQSTIMMAQDDPDDGEEIELRTSPKLGGINGPSRAPARFRLTLSAFLHQESFQLVIHDTAQGQFSYCIYNEDELVVSQGPLDFSNTESLSIDLNGLEAGEYRLEIYNGNKTHTGFFYLD